MNKDELKSFLEKGSEIAGGAIGGAVGLIGGSVGAVLGGGLGVAITIGVKELISRQLSNREEMRVAASATYIISGIKEKLNAGSQIRQDSFFDNSNGRSSAEELFEGVLLKCKNQYQEKKIKYISKIFEKATFDSNLTPEIVNQILSTAEDFTYRKFCIISFFGRKEREYDCNKLMQEVYHWYPDAKCSIDLQILQQDIFDLITYGIIDHCNHMVMSGNGIIPGLFKLTEVGEVIFKIMDLIEIPREDTDSIYLELQYKEEFGVSIKNTKNGVKEIP